jgi:hypothetical protein
MRGNKPVQNTGRREPTTETLELVYRIHHVLPSFEGKTPAETYRLLQARRADELAAKAAENRERERHIEAERIEREREEVEAERRRNEERERERARIREQRRKLEAEKQACAEANRRLLAMLQAQRAEQAMIESFVDEQVQRAHTFMKRRHHG